jgi:SAM-dependent methyltransferase/uncharacterized protein YbaR (Trm112 family)
MLSSTLELLRCPTCLPDSSRSGKLQLEARKKEKLPSGQEDIVFGSLVCSRCRGRFPILAGVAVLLEDPGSYLIAHIKGVSREIVESDYPKEFRSAMKQAKSEIETEHIEEDLESERVAALYVMTHYLAAEGGWWKPKNGEGSSVIDEWVRKYWDQGPFEKIRQGISDRAGSTGTRKNKLTLVELGCGSGGLLRVLEPHLSRYLGIDSSFASIVQARRLALGAGAQAGPVRAPGDLLDGSVSQDISKWIRKPKTLGPGTVADFIVGDATQPGLAPESWDACASLNMIDMLEQPEVLPEIQKSLVRPGGWVVQSSPYIWHPEIARSLRKKLSKKPLDSASAVLELYRRAGLRIDGSEEQVPWLFFKNFRQIELYSVHVLFAARA